MEISTIIGIVTVIVTYGLGIVSKKCSFIKNNMIPIQNLIIGIIAFVVNYIMTKDFNVAIAGAGLFTGGLYDVVNNLNKLKFTDSIEVGENEGGNVDD